MTDSTPDSTNADNGRDGTPPIPQGDRLDSLLRAWHDENSAAARAKRDEILRRIAAEEAARRARRPAFIEVIARIGTRRLAAAALFVVATALFLSLFIGPIGTKEAFADDRIMQVAEGGALEAIDADGNPLGACPLRSTDVSVEITGPFARTVVEQTYANPFPRTIEAVYTFPLSNRAAVDRLTMIVRGPSGEKIVEGEVKERSVAKAIYEEARESGYVASLLEQERPNIFTQSVANIEPGATVVVRIATIEVVERKDGVAQYSFPMVVGPRYIPGKTTLAANAMPKLPEGWTVREGLVLRGPARIHAEAGAAVSGARLETMLLEAIPVRPVAALAVDTLLSYGDAVPFMARYANGSAERGMFSPTTSIGEVNGRFFFATAAAQGVPSGTGFANPTDQVPDADRVTPMPTRPETRAGHDISVKVSIDTGGAAVGTFESVQHEVRVEESSPTRRVISLADRKTIPNRDFILRWQTGSAGVEPAFFAHTSGSADLDAKGGFFTLMLEPPARVAPADIRPRELVFVLDVSGSMNGFPIEKSKELARKAIARMRPNDTFNIITFAGSTAVLWPEPKAATAENIAAADRFIAGTSGGGGTEMMTAINAALVQPGRSALDPAKLLALPADGRGATIAVSAGRMSPEGARWKIDAGVGPDGAPRSVFAEIPVVLPENPKRLAILLEGAWTTKDGERVFVARTARFEDANARTRMVFFLTDGYIGNDQAVVQAVRDNARASRVYSFGIGTSVNRFLLDEMARAGRGVCEVVTLAEDADAVVERLVRRIDAPVLTDLEIDIDPALGIRELMPSADGLPDLHDVEPLVLIGRYERAARGAITLRGRTGAGPWERTISVELPEREERHDVVPALWARAKVDALLTPKLAAVENGSLDAPTRRAVIRLGEAFRIMTPYTSFIAVEKSRVVVGGKPMLVAVPVELPSGTSWNGFFGEGVGAADLMAAEVRGVRRADGAVAEFGREFSRVAVERGIVPDATREAASHSSDMLDAVPPFIAASAAPAPPPPSSGAPQATPTDEKAEVASRLTRLPAPRAPGGADIVVLPSGKSKQLATAAAPKPASGQVGGVPGRRLLDQAGTSARAAPNVRGGLGGGGGGSGGGFAALEEASTGGAAADSAESARSEAVAADPSRPTGQSALDAATRDALVRVLDRRLVIVALAVILGENARVPAIAAELDLPLDNGFIQVAMKVTRTDGKIPEGLLDALRGVGCTVSAEDAARGLLVVQVPPTALPALARVDGVLRVEPCP